MEKDEKAIKVEPEKITRPVKKLTTLERERIAARQRLQEEEVRRYLVGSL